MTTNERTNSLGGEVQRRLLVLGLQGQTELPGEPQHVLDGVVDPEAAGVVQRRAAVVVLAAQQGLHALTLKGAHIITPLILMEDAAGALSYRPTLAFFF